jgi:uncharacterized protein YneF (UPF0154 family)
MRWLLIALLVSLAALLLAAGGVARHILLERRELRSRPPVNADSPPDRDSAKETDVESKD